MSLANIVVVNMPPFRKICPDCGIHLHTKKLKCPCGHSFRRGSKPNLSIKNNNKALEAKAKHAAYQSRKRALETDQVTEMRREADAASKASKRLCESQEQAEKQKASDTTSTAKRDFESQDHAERRKAADRESKASKRLCESQEQAEKRKASDTASTASKRD